VTDDLPPFHTWIEAIQLLYKEGGAIYRFGNQYPLYIKTEKGIQTRNCSPHAYAPMRTVNTYFMADSSGRYIGGDRHYYNAYQAYHVLNSPVSFTADEQHSINWVYMTAEELVARDAKEKAEHEEACAAATKKAEEDWAKYQEQQKARKVAEANNVIDDTGDHRPWWQRIVFDKFRST
jgi:hypothetical protein